MMNYEARAPYAPNFIIQNSTPSISMPFAAATWAEKIFAGDRRAIASAISAVENDQPRAVELLKLLFPKAGRSYVVGVTGSPGVGKSTLVEKLAGEYRRSGSRVGIIAVDPTSPFSGGAILGDRIRMQSLARDDGVYIRSMATRGQLGGLAPASHDVVTILDAAGYDAVMIETVGVGQDEVEVARLAEVTALLLVPGMGDDIQTFKAGVMEIADVFVVNKADRPGADRVEQEITSMLSIAPRQDGWQPPIVKTVATTGEGVPEVRKALEQFREFGNQSALKLDRQRNQCRSWFLQMLRQGLFVEVAAQKLRDGSIERAVEDIVARRRDPYSLVEEIIEKSKVES